jgi:hypothetical protein
VTEDGEIHTNTPAACKLVELLGFNRPRLREFRGLWIGIVRLATRHDPDLLDEDSSVSWSRPRSRLPAGGGRRGLR